MLIRFAGMPLGLGGLIGLSALDPARRPVEGVIA